MYCEELPKSRKLKGKNRGKEEIADREPACAASVGPSRWGRRRRRTRSVSTESRSRVVSLSYCRQIAARSSAWSHIRINRLLKWMERETGIEPVTSSLGSWRSTAELLPPNASYSIQAAQLRKTTILFHSIQILQWRVAGLVWRVRTIRLPDLCRGRLRTRVFRRNGSRIVRARHKR